MSSYTGQTHDEDLDSSLLMLSQAFESHDRDGVILCVDENLQNCKEEFFDHLILCLKNTNSNNEMDMNIVTDVFKLVALPQYDAIASTIIAEYLKWDEKPFPADLIIDVFELIDMDNMPLTWLELFDLMKTLE